MEGLLRKRDAIKGKLSRVKAKLLKIPETTRVEVYEEVLNDIDDCFRDFKKVKDSIYTEIDVMESSRSMSSEDINKTFEEQENTFFDIDEAFIEVKAMLRFAIDRYKKPNLNSSSSGGNVSFGFPSAGPPKLKLPQMKLPKFSGKYEDYVPFAEKFKMIIHNNKEIPVIQKYQLLLDCLDDKVRRGFDHLEFTEANYEVLVEKLDKRYLNKKLSVDSHISGLVNLKAMVKESARELQGLLDETSIHISALKTLDVEVDSWDEILVYLVSVKLDPETRKKWEETVDKTVLPTWGDMQTFLQKRCNSLESVELAVDFRRRKDSKPVNSLFVSNDADLCLKCKGSHSLDECSEFVGLSLDNKFSFLKSNLVCFNCLKKDHVSNKCSMECSCSKCGKSCKKKHHSLLHSPRGTDEKDDKKQNPDEERKKPEPKAVGKGSYSCSMDKEDSQKVILMTALVYIYGRNDQPQLARALLDSGSEINFMTSTFADKLGLEQENHSQSIIGVQGQKSSSKGRIKAYIRSRNKDYGRVLQFLVVDKITKNVPSKSFSVKEWGIPSSVSLADPSFNKSQSIDLLIGGEIFMELLMKGRIRVGDGLPLLQESWLGWIWSGKLNECRMEEVDSGDDFVCNLVTNDELSNQVERLWQLENPPVTGDEKSVEEDSCERDFLKWVSRCDDGRYQVGLMVKDNPPELGDSKKIAISRLNSMWRRLETNPDLKTLYCEFMDEYLKLGHMAEVTNEKDGQFGGFYIPHHGVLKPDSSTTKLRVVFNASQKTSNGISLNDLLMNGGFQQRSLLAIMMQQRLFKIAFSVDVIKMYRQIWVDPAFWSLLRIVWKSSMKDPVKVYQLKTVTYGCKDAPFSAVRVLIQIAMECKDNYPLAHLVLLMGFYIDNGLYGANTVGEAKRMIEELMAVMNGAGMGLHKWCSNESRLLENIPTEKLESYSFDENENEVVKVLGVLWKPKTDVYSFSVSKSDLPSPISKRTILSELARIFDPLGLLSPIVVKGRILLQKLWISKFDWDEELPEDICTEWRKFRKDLELVERIEVPRFLNPFLATKFELFGYADASKDAYGMCLYLKSICENGNSSKMLMYSKSRVAPLGPITIPRLELEAALLLAEGVRTVLDSVDLKFERIRLFSDSRVVLAWLQTDIIKLQIYVANRVRKIRNLSEAHEWNYVSTKQNPADVVSRGIDAKKLKDLELWWHGPLEEDCEDASLVPEDMDLYRSEIRKLDQESISLPVLEDSGKFDLFNQRLKFQSLLRVAAYVLRFIGNCKGSKNNIPKSTGRLTTIELQLALETVVRTVQMDCFPNEIELLKRDGTLPPNHPMKSLNLILINGVIRVGGRLVNSRFNVDKKHQMLIPKNHRFSDMIINDLHIRYLHVGPQGLLSIIRERFWLVNGKSYVRKLLHSCILCFRVNPRDVETFMGSLPNYRVEPSFPFYNTGVDCGGPFMIRYGGPRSKVLNKSWFVVFICMVTKAIHLELITSLSSEAFRACLQRFICRRGRPFGIHSDNGTNFVGCKRELEELRQLFNKENREKIENFCLEEGINWSNIPPRASHFGGEWEAGVKSVKYHYKRIAGNALLTYEETLTLLIQIEGILNSRPLYAMSSDPNDFNPLTPAHFLIGRSMTTFPEPDLSDINWNRLTRFERLTHIRQHFWKRFSVEYVTSLQKRSKWFKKKPVIKTGQLVIMKEEGLPSFQWKLGRISRVFPGKDDIVRVALIKTPEGQEYKRDTQKFCVLPLETEVE